MKTIVAVAVMAILVSIIAVSTLVVTDNIDARTIGSDSVPAHSLVDSTSPYVVQMRYIHAKRLLDNSIILGEEQTSRFFF